VYSQSTQPKQNAIILGNRSIWLLFILVLRVFGGFSLNVFFFFLCFVEGVTGIRDDKGGAHAANGSEVLLPAESIVRNFNLQLMLKNFKITVSYEKHFNFLIYILQK
tara:strand:+ start:53 stop:373 length:321 start_codon:yes stop_codon:yes gene_type:complete